ncbi:hypothetical protein B0T20DRAFT_423422 [Sordaria brevicollis]|uniref:Infection structure specific protein n=1 Tax=Sordaria brevicollis TaxID=83679 RepID=A0AAE0P1J8_SORBR|nr:hypothetical protein B0T20DRAFT_423422 [Sordaria brevicollis]
MQLKTLTTLAAVTTVSALAAPPAQHQAIAALPPAPTPAPAFPGSLRSDPRPRVVQQIKQLKRDDDDMDEPIYLDLGSDDYSEPPEYFPAGLPTSLRPLYTSCLNDFGHYMLRQPSPSGKLLDYLETALYGDMDLVFSTSEDAFKVMCGTFTSPLTPPASLASTFSAYMTESASYLSAHSSEMSSLASACKPIHQDAVISMFMPHKNYEECTSVAYNYMVAYASQACVENEEDCTLTNDWPPMTTGYNMGATTTAASAGAGPTTGAAASGSAAAAASSTTASGGAAPKQTFAAAAVLGGLVAAVAAL